MVYSGLAPDFVTARAGRNNVAAFTAPDFIIPVVHIDRVNAFTAPYPVVPVSCGDLVIAGLAMDLIGTAAGEDRVTVSCTCVFPFFVIAEYQVGRCACIDPIGPAAAVNLVSITFTEYGVVILVAVNLIVPCAAVMTSTPASPRMKSLPSSPQIWSASVPPQILSSSLPALMISIPAEPLISS